MTPCLLYPGPSATAPTPPDFKCRPYPILSPSLTSPFLSLPISSSPVGNSTSFFYYLSCFTYLFTNIDISQTCPTTTATPRIAASPFGPQEMTRVNGLHKRPICPVQAILICIQRPATSLTQRCDSIPGDGVALGRYTSRMSLRPIITPMGKAFLT